MRVCVVVVVVCVCVCVPHILAHLLGSAVDWINLEHPVDHNGRHRERIYTVVNAGDGGVSPFVACK